MQRRAFLAFLLFAAAPLSAQPAPRKALFWKVSSGKNVVYLLGSVHFGSPKMYPLPAAIEDAFAKADALAVEVDLNHTDMAQMAGFVMQNGMYTAGDTLWDHVSADTKQRLEKFCAANGFPCDRLATMKPWLVSVTIASIPLVKSGMNPELGIDKYFLDKAKDKRVVEIESADSQFKLISGFPDEVQEKALAASLKDADQAVELARKMQQAWIAGDAAALEKMIAANTTGPPEMTRAMLQDRNPHMADVAEQLLNSKETGFVVVGAAHLIGKDGVLAILQKRGYKVE